MRISTYNWLAILAVVGCFWAAQQPHPETQGYMACWEQLQEVGAKIEARAAITGEYPESVSELPRCPLSRAFTLSYTKGKGARPYQLHCSANERTNPGYNGVVSVLER